LYLRGAFYEFTRGFNWRAIGALCAGAGVALIGLVIAELRFLYDYSWFVGFAISFVTYFFLMQSQRQAETKAAEA
jgi:NCS1 family nucleobase:cation symporter-1